MFYGDAKKSLDALLPMIASEAGTRWRGAC